MRKQLLTERPLKVLLLPELMKTLCYACVLRFHRLFSLIMQYIILEVKIMLIMATCP